MLRYPTCRRWAQFLLIPTLLTAGAVLAPVLYWQVANRSPAVSAAPVAPPDASALPAPADSTLQAMKAKYRRPTTIPFPKANPFSTDRADLGRTLFFDPRLSDSNWVSCATCHNPGLGWGDGLPRAIGHGMRLLGRRTPTILDLAWGELYFWDGRASSLEEQALGPIQSPGEMHQPLDALLVKLRAVSEYTPLFERAYPGEGISASTIGKAIASYERTVVSEKAPFDRWIEGDERAISESAKNGFRLFNTKANCSACHSGWRLTDDGFHDIGIPGNDRGRGVMLEEIEVSQFAFKTPTLRNVDRRAPYMHDGSSPTLEDVIDLYDAGGRVRRPSLAKEVRPLRLLPQDKRDLITFLKTLTSTDKPVEIPLLPR